MRYTELLEAADIDSPQFKSWFVGSKVRNRNGTPKLCYHGTIQYFTDAFRPFTHYGTLTAASDRVATKWDKQLLRPAEKNQWTGKVIRRAKYSQTASDYNEGAHIIPVYLSIKHPFRYTDYGAEGSGSMDVFTAMRRRGIISRETYERQFTFNVLKTMRFIIDTLSKRGYDGLVYRNTGEDPGKVSYVIFRPDQVWPAMLDRPPAN